MGGVAIFGHRQRGRSGTTLGLLFSGGARRIIDLVMAATSTRWLRPMLLSLVGVACLAASRVPRAAAVERRDGWPKVVDVPFAPSPTAAPFAVLGYRELGADLLWVRTIGYFGGDDDTADGVASLVEAVVALDPRFERAYDWGTRAVTLADHGVDQAAIRRAVALLERGMREFPRSWKIHRLAADVLIQDVQPTDPAERQRNLARGAELLERSVRMPGSPPSLASTVAAELWSRLGRHERAIDSLHEMVLLTDDTRAQERLLDKLAKLKQETAADVSIALLDERRAFIDRWRRERPALPPTLYVLVGPRRGQFLAPHDLAVDRDLIGSDLAEPLEPLRD